MKREYRVIALDMDGTVLNDEKKIDERTQKAIHGALAAGKEVVFCSGRSYDEMADILADYPDMNYLCGESGALVYDLKKKKPIAMISVDEETIGKVREIVRGKDIMMHIISEGRALVNRSQVHNMEHYQMGIYQDMFEKVGTVVEDVFQTIEEEKCSVEKINLFCANEAIRTEAMELMKKEEIPLTMVNSEIASLECSPLGLNKAVGLRRLCQELGITMEQVIMVGDADNDLAALKAAGLAVAMGNANEQVKAVSQVQVADNNHDGCAEAIEKFLLKEEQKMKIIARIHSDFKEKFGIPRQSGIVPELKAKIIFEPEYRNPHAVLGLEEYSHIWILWQFSQAVRDTWSPTVLPPRLGGKTHVGVFATRSPFRPNPIGLSSVRLNKVEMHEKLGPVLHVSGADLLDGTPIYDIKPYLTYTDSHPDAVCGFADRVKDYELEVVFPEELLELLPRKKREAAIGILRQDPRPSYQNDPERRYGVAFAGYDIRFHVREGVLTVCEVVQLENSIFPRQAE